MVVARLCLFELGCLLKVYVFDDLYFSLPLWAARRRLGD